MITSTIKAPLSYRFHPTAAINCYLLIISNNPVKKMTIYLITSILKIDLLLVCTPTNTKAGFRAMRISPFNRDFFTQHDIRPSSSQKEALKREKTNVFSDGNKSENKSTDLGDQCFCIKVVSAKNHRFNVLVVNNGPMKHA